MKKLLSLLTILATLSTTSALADGQTATLQQGEQMTAFYGIDAFREAYEAADSGAVITLSPGRFNIVDSICKPITVIGTYGIRKDNLDATIVGQELIINANHVTIEGIFVSTFSSNDLGKIRLRNVSDCHLKRSRMANLYASATHTNTLVDQCIIMNGDHAIEKGQNYCIRNSTIGYFAKMNTAANPAYITNCVIRKWYDYSSSSIQPREQPYAIYKNNVLGLYIGAASANQTVSCTSPSEFYYNNFYSHCSTSTSNYVVKPSFVSGCLNEGNIISETNHTWSSSYPDTGTSYGTGQDGTPIGVMGGTGFSEYPSIPHVTGREIDSNTDAEGNLNVKITVQAGQ